MRSLQSLKATGAIGRIAGDVLALETAWERSPLVSTGLDDFDDVFSPSIADRLIHSGLPPSAIRMYRNGTKVLRDCVVAKSSGDDTSAPHVCGAALVKQISEGTHVILEMAQLYCPEVARFSAELGRELGFGALCGVFITPAGSRGVLHYDTSSVFLRQVCGSKHWRVFAPLERWPAEDWRSTMNLDTEQVLDVVLKRGDCLYIPRGFIHAGDATAEGSIHLTVAIRPPTWGDVLRLAVEHFSKSEALREAIPPYFVHADEPGLFREKLQTLRVPALESLRLPNAPSAGTPLALAVRQQNGDGVD